MMNTRCTKLSMVRDDAKSSKTSNKKCPVVLHGDLIYTVDPLNTATLRTVEKAAVFEKPRSSESRGLRKPAVKGGGERRGGIGGTTVFQICVII